MLFKANRNQTENIFLVLVVGLGANVVCLTGEIFRWAFTPAAIYQKGLKKNPIIEMTWWVLLNAVVVLYVRGKLAGKAERVSERSSSTHAEGPDEPAKSPENEQPSRSTAAAQSTPSTETGVEEAAQFAFSE